MRIRRILGLYASGAVARGTHTRSSHSVRPTSSLGPVILFPSHFFLPPLFIYLFYFRWGMCPAPLLSFLPHSTNYSATH
jgi:hypothetical protein